MKAKSLGVLLTWGPVQVYPPVKPDRECRKNQEVSSNFLSTSSESELVGEI